MPRFEVMWPKGISYRTAPDLEAKAQDRHPAKHGDIIIGKVSGGSWVTTEEGLYLPLKSPDGKPLLKQKPDFVPWQDTSDGAAGAPAELSKPPLPAAAGPGGYGSAQQSELDSFHQKYDKKYGRPKGPAAGGPFGSAATSHERNASYMQEFRTGLEEMGVDTRDDPFLNAYAPSSGAGLNSRPSSRASTQAPSSIGGPTLRASSTSASKRSLVMAGAVNAGRRAMTPSTDAGSERGLLSLCGAMVVTRSASSGTGKNWKEGPANAIVPVREWTSIKHGQEVKNSHSSGRVIDVSDRNIICMSVLGEKAVMGSADHGLKEVNLRAGQVLRNLYAKRHGHTEWVTTVSHCRDGRILSGGMDSKLCLWNTAGVECKELNGHLGSVSRVRTHAQSDLAISSGYDRTLRAWDLRSKTEVACCTGHDAPVLDFIWADDVAASGDRGGTVRVWDVSRGEHIAALRGHKGHITAMLALPEPCSATSAANTAPGSSRPFTSLIATGAQDGHIRIWDLRQRLNAFNLASHVGGAVNELGVTMGASPPVLISVGADGRLVVTDPRSNFAPLFDISGITQDFIYSLLVLDDLAFVGDGRGQVTCFDVRSGQTKYKLTAGQNAIRCIGATESCLICAGDDGNAVMFDF